MAEEGGEPDEGDRPGGQVGSPGDKHRNDPLEDVPREGEAGRLAPGEAEHVGRPRVARPAGAGVRNPERPGDEDGGRDRAEEVPGRDEEGGSGRRDGPRHAIASSGEGVKMPLRVVPYLC